MKPNIAKLKKISRYILLNYRNYGIFLTANQISFLRKFRQENFTPTEKQISYFYLIIAQIQSKNIQQQLKALKYKISKLEEFSKNIEL